MSVGIQGNAEAVVVVVRRVVPVPVRRLTIRGIVVPNATTVHAVRSLKVRPPSKVLSQNVETPTSRCITKIKNGMVPVNPNEKIRAQGAPPPAPQR